MEGDTIKNQVYRKRKRTIAPKLAEKARLVKRCVVHDIFRRNVRGVSTRGSVSQTLGPRRFKNFKRVCELDTYDEKAPILHLPAMRIRSRIVELVVAENLIFGLTHSGVCMAYDLITKKRLCIMNTSQDEVVRSLFHAKCGKSLITVSVYRDDNFSSLKCSTTLLEDVRAGRPDKARPIFQSELLRWPGFVEFDDVNCKVLTYSAKDRKYKVWSLVDYSFVYSMEEQNIEEIKISPGIMLVIFNKSDDQRRIPLQIRNIETGEILKEFEHELNPHKEIEFIEQFNEKLLVKQQDGPLQIMDVLRDGCVSSSSAKRENLNRLMFSCYHLNHKSVTCINHIYITRKSHKLEHIGTVFIDSRR